MKVRKKIGDLGKEQIQQLVQDFLDELGEGAVALLNYFEERDCPEYVTVELDESEKVISFTAKDGSHYAYNLKSETIDALSERITALEEERGVDNFENIEDPEQRLQVGKDAEDKIFNYRKPDGTLVENAGIETPIVKTDNLLLSEEGLAAFEKELEEDGFGTSKTKYLPLFGKVTINTETFYLTADSRYSTLYDLALIQVLDDTAGNAGLKVPLSYYYIKSTLTPLPGGGYDRTSITSSSVRLNFYAAGQVTKIDSKYYVISTLTNNGDNTYSVNSNSIEVNQFTDIPPYKAWIVNKKLEHYCTASIDFAPYYNKNNIVVSIKYQGSGSLGHWQRSLRITFYKSSAKPYYSAGDDKFGKKDKVKIGEMFKLSGYNMKSFYTDTSKLVDPVLSEVFKEVWETRGTDCYPWNKDNAPYNGATGMCEYFPIETYIDNEFYGIQMFGLKKDEKNYMLDGDDDSSGIFVSGQAKTPTHWTEGDHTLWEDEMMDDMSQETADAIDELLYYIKGFINGTIVIDGQEVEFTNDMLEERIDISSLIDYYIGLQVFFLLDNGQHNMILYSGRDKKKFYPFFYDLDFDPIIIQAQQYDYSYNSDFITVCKDGTTWAGVLDMSLWEKLCDEYKDSIINRYYALRKSVLNTGNIRQIYLNLSKNIPNTAIVQQINRWNRGNPEDFLTYLNVIDKRLDWLDDTQFNLG